jgi:hypothetical protein
MNLENAEEEFYKKIPFSSGLSFHSRYFLEHFLGKIAPSFFQNWNTNSHKRLHQKIKLLPEMPFLKLEPLEQLDAHTFKKLYLKRGKPFLLKGGASNWKAFKEWDFEFFRTNYPEEPVVLSHHKAFGEQHLQPEVTDLKDILDHLDGPEKKYARFNPLLDNHPELLQSLDLKWLDSLMLPKRFNHHVLFIGGKDTKTGTHCAGNENIFVQLRGQKKWYMWDQRATVLFDPPVNRGPAKSSPFDPMIPDFETFPGIRQIPVYEIILDPGDILYIPSYYWHYVYNTSSSIGIGIRWLSAMATLRNNPLFAILEPLNTSPPFWQTMRMGKGWDFNEILTKNRKITGE